MKIKSNIIFGSIKISFIIIILSINLEAYPQRVAQVDFDLRKVFKLYSSPGRDTSLYFPCNIEYATAGTADDLKLSLPKKFPNLLTVFILHGKAESTSLKVFCSDRVFIFDIVPSTENHIDFLKIINSHGELPRIIEERSTSLHLEPKAQSKKTLAKDKINGKIIYSSKEGIN